LNKLFENAGRGHFHGRRTDATVAIYGMLKGLSMKANSTLVVLLGASLAACTFAGCGRGSASSVGSQVNPVVAPSPIPVAQAAVREALKYPPKTVLEWSTATAPTKTGASLVRGTVQGKSVPGSPRHKFEVTLAPEEETGEWKLVFVVVNNRLLFADHSALPKRATTDVSEETDGLFNAADRVPITEASHQQKSPEPAASAEPVAPPVEADSNDTAEEETTADDRTTASSGEVASTYDEEPGLISSDEEPESPEASEPESPTLASPAVIRTWRSTSGMFSVEAIYRGVSDGRVSLEKLNGTILSVPIEKLSIEDQEWIVAQDLRDALSLDD
jgi:hypothetical protein